MNMFTKKIQSSHLFFLSFCFTCFISIISCETSNTVETENNQLESQRITVANVNDGQISQQVGDMELENLAAKAFNAIPGKEKVEKSFFKNASVQGSKGHYYLIGKGKDAQGNCVSVASKLESSPQPSKGTLFFNGDLRRIDDPGPETHSCTGDPCENCEFTRDDNEEINGCDCESVFGLCNHTVTSGG